MAYFEEVWSLLLHAEDRGRQQLSHSVWLTCFSLVFKNLAETNRPTRKTAVVCFWKISDLSSTTSSHSLAAHTGCHTGCTLQHLLHVFFIFNELGVKNILRVSSCFLPILEAFWVGHRDCTFNSFAVLMCCDDTAARTGTFWICFFHSNNQKKPS